MHFTAFCIGFCLFGVDSGKEYILHFHWNVDINFFSVIWTIDKIFLRVCAVACIIWSIEKCLHTFFLVSVCLSVRLFADIISSFNCKKLLQKGFSLIFRPTQKDNRNLYSQFKFPLLKRENNIKSCCSGNDTHSLIHDRTHNYKTFSPSNHLIFVVSIKRKTL